MVKRLEKSLQIQNMQNLMKNAESILRTLPEASSK